MSKYGTVRGLPMSRKDISLPGSPTIDEFHQLIQKLHDSRRLPPEKRKRKHDDIDEPSFREMIAKFEPKHAP